MNRLLLLPMIALLGACGGAPSEAAVAPPSRAPVAAPSGPGAQCLAIAGAKREPGPKQPEKISVRHVLVKYDGAKKADASVKRTREEACLRAMEARDKVRGGADFVAVVKEYSEEPGAASRGGLVPGIERKDVVPPFADAAFELEPSQVSDVVETDFGFHVIQRTE